MAWEVCRSFQICQKSSRTPHRERERRGACDFATSFTQSIKACFSNLNILLWRRIAGMGIGERSWVRLRDSS
jgi:hypothetical protein